MLFLFILVISIVQGITEFLPISSSGHLVLTYNLFGIEGETLLLSIILHLATLVSVIIYYRKEIWTLIKHPLCKTNKLLVVATIPTVLFVLIFKGVIDNSFRGDWLIFGFIITALVLGIADYLSPNNKKVSKKAYYTTETSLMTNSPESTKNIKSRGHNLDYKRKQDTIQPSKNNYRPSTIKEKDITNIGVTYWHSAVMGLVQGFACFPAISRSGSTIASALIMKIDKDDATTFSFLMSIPIIIASLLYEVIFPSPNNFSLNFGLLIVAFVITSIVGYFSIQLMGKVVKNSKLSYFSFYLLALVFILLFAKFAVKFFWYLQKRDSLCYLFFIL